jgi:hypothetical protein
VETTDLQHVIDNLFESDTPGQGLDSNLWKYQCYALNTLVGVNQTNIYHRGVGVSLPIAETMHKITY